MLLRNSIVKTKRFFHKTIESFMSFVSGGYQKLPKTPPFNPCSCAGGGADTHSHRSFGELDNFYGDFSSRMVPSNPEKANMRNKKKPPQMSKKQQPIDHHKEIYGEVGSFLKFGKQSPAKMIRREEEKGKELSGADSHNSHGGGEMGSHSRGDERRNVVVVQKLKELEMMDASDMEHVLDIEEVIHYYSHLTCPAYLDIVNSFFMDMYSDFLPQPSSSSFSTVNNNYYRRHRF